MESITLDAFNIIPGAAIEVQFEAFWPKGFVEEIVVVTGVSRNCDTEKIGVAFRRASTNEQGTRTFDFNDKVELFGICVNHDDDSDFNIGRN